MTERITELTNNLFEYLMLDPIKIIYEDLGEEDSRFYTHDLYIAINSKYKDNELETMKCLIHEIKHYEQLVVVICGEKENPQYEYWKKEFKTKLKPEDELCKYIEIDAFAFTKYILKEWYGIEYHHHDKKYDNLLDLFINKYYR